MSFLQYRTFVSVNLNTAWVCMNLCLLAVKALLCPHRDPEGDVLTAVVFHGIYRRKNTDSSVCLLQVMILIQLLIIHFHIHSV